MAGGAAFLAEGADRAELRLAGQGGAGRVGADAVGDGDVEAERAGEGEGRRGEEGEAEEGKVSHGTQASTGLPVCETPRWASPDGRWMGCVRFHLAGAG